MWKLQAVAVLAAWMMACLLGCVMFMDEPWAWPGIRGSLAGLGVASWFYTPDSLPGWRRTARWSFVGVGLAFALVAVPAAIWMCP